MKKLITLLLISWFSLTAKANDCPPSLTFGNPDWPNKIELTQGDLTRVFYFDKAHLTKKNNTLRLTTPAVIPFLRPYEGPTIAFTFSEVVMEGSEFTTGQHSISAVDLNTTEIGCLEIERNFGGSGIAYDKSMVIDKGNDEHYNVNINVISKSDGTTLRAELKQVSYSEVVNFEPTIATYETSGGPFEGVIQYNEIHNESTNQSVGLHGVFDTEEIINFSVDTFDGNRSVYRLGTMGTRFLKINQYDGASIDLDIYEFKKEDIFEVERLTFFDFALGDLLILEKNPIYVTNIKGPVDIYGEQHDTSVDLGTYYFDPETALEEGYHYEAIVQNKENKNVLDAWDHYDFKKLPPISLTHQSGEYKFIEKWEGNQLYSAFLPIGEEEEKLDCDKIFGAVQKAVEEKYGPDGPRPDQETEMMQIFAEKAAKEGIDIGDVSKLNADEIRKKFMAKSQELCSGGGRMISEPRERTAKIDAKGQLVSREYFAQVSSSTLLLNKKNGDIHFIAENDNQGKQNYEMEDLAGLPDMAMFVQIIGGIDFEEGKTYALDFQDYKLTQSNRFSSGSEGEKNVRKQSVYPVRAEFQLEVLGVEKIGGKEAFKIAVHHKDYGDGHLLLTPVTGPRPGYIPNYSIGAFLYLDKSSGILLQVENEYQDVVFNYKSQAID